jgi:cytochrome c oxidase subunit IV
MTTIAPPIRTYLKIAAALLALLVLTVLVARIDLGPLNAVVALSVAIAKAILVAIFFMHLNLSSPMVRVFAGAGLVWLSIMMGLTLGDYLTRQPEIRGSMVAPGNQEAAHTPPPPP